MHKIILEVFKEAEPIAELLFPSGALSRGHSNVEFPSSINSQGKAQRVHLQHFHLPSVSLLLSTYPLLSHSFAV